MDYPVSQQQYPSIRPCIVELLRTGYRPAELLLRVERVIEVLISVPPPIPTTEDTEQLCNSCNEKNDDNEEYEGGCEDSPGSISGSASYKTYRMFLSDGEHVIQALLRKQLHCFVSSMDEIAAGAALRIENYELRTANRVVSRGSRHEPGKIVFLAVGKYRRVDVQICTSDGKGIVSKKEHREVDNETRVVKRGRAREPEEDDGLQGGLWKKQRTKPIIPRYGLIISEATNEASSVNGIKYEGEGFRPSQSGDTRTSNSADILKSGPDTPSTRTTTPQDSSSRNIHPGVVVKGSHSSMLPPSGSTFHSNAATATAPGATSSKRIVSQQDCPKPTSLEPSRNLLTLSDLLYPRTPFPKRNYICDVIAVISWISPQVIKRAYMPPKRDLRLIDPTIIDNIDKRRSTTLPSLLPSSAQPSATANGALGISMSVFVDAANFHPPVGTVALFRGLRTHEWDGISLNAYEKDCRGKEWFVTNPNNLAKLGADVSALKKWWLETEMRWEDARKDPVFHLEE